MVQAGGYWGVEGFTHEYEECSEKWNSPACLCLPLARTGTDDRPAVTVVGERARPRTFIRTSKDNKAHTRNQSNEKKKSRRTGVS